MTHKEKDELITQAAWAYENSSNKNISKIAKEFKISRAALSRKLHSLNIEVIHSQNRIRFNQHVFDCIDTEEKAYWLGFIYADGTISSSPLNNSVKTEYTFELSLALSDLTHLKKFETFMEYPNKIKTDSYRCRFYVKNKHLWNTLNNYGCTPNKSLTLEFPDESIFKNKSLIRHFIRGYFDGDGCVCITHTNEIKQYPVINLLGTQNFLEIIKSNINPNKNVKIHDYKNKENGCKAIYYWGKSCLVSLQYLYENSNLYLDRKFNKYLEICRLYE